MLHRRSLCHPEVSVSRENALLKSLPVGISAPRDRGRPLFPEDVKEKNFKPRHSIAWIKRNVAPHDRIQIGRTAAWFERNGGGPSPGLSGKRSPLRNER